MISRFFIDRPIFAAVLSIVITLAGFISIFFLPLAQFPAITPPTVSVSCVYPGASAREVADAVAAPIEQQVNGVEGIMYMSSQCANDGTYNLTVTFQHGMNLDVAQVLVQNRVNLAVPSLPEVIKATGVMTRKRSPDILMGMAINSPDGRYDQLYLSNFALMQLKDEIARVDGVGDVLLFGQRDYSMRIWLDPDKLAMRKITASDVVSALREQNAQVAAGSIGQEPIRGRQEAQITLSTLGRLSEVDQFADVIVKVGKDRRITRIKDIGHVRLGAKNEDTLTRLDGRETAFLAIFQMPDANALDVRDRVLAKMEELKQSFPEGVNYEIGFDTTPYTSESIHEVVKSLRDAIILVAAVVLLFLQNWRSAVIPLVAVPVAIIGTFAAMLAMGFSLNNLTLFGLVLSIGIVVDDAIVVVEAVEHHIEHGMRPREATIKAMSQVSGPVIAVGLVLTAVFVPCAFITGITGQFFRQFAVTISVSTIISAFNSLTLSPALAALLLKPLPPVDGPRVAGKAAIKPPPLPRLAFVIIGALLGWFFAAPWVQPHLVARWPEFPVVVLRPAAAILAALVGWLVSRPLNWSLSHCFRAFDRLFRLGTRGYVGMVGGILRVNVVALAAYAVLLGFTYWQFTTTRRGFIPSQDMGYLMMGVQLPDSASRERTNEVMRQIETIALGVPGIRHVTGITGTSFVFSASGPNFGSLFINLKNYPERRDPSLSADAIANKLRQEFAKKITDANVAVFPPPPVRGVGRAGGFAMMVQDRGDLGPVVLQEQTEKLVREATQLPRPDGKPGPAMPPGTLFSVFRANVPQVHVEPNPAACMMRGVTMKDFADTLQVYEGSYYVNDFNLFGRTWQVIVQAEGPFRDREEVLPKLQIRNARGQMVPIGSLADQRMVTGPLVLTRYNMYLAAPINGGAAPGVSSRQAMDMLQDLAHRELPKSMGFEWTDMSYLEQLAGNTAMVIFGFAVVMVFLVLAAQYESWSLPLAVILVVPTCLLSAIQGVRYADLDINIFTQIGFVVLVGLASKNAILIVEFAKQQRAEGLSRRDVTLAACQLRLRPIIMTSLSFILGVVPLIVSSGAGAEMRRTLGTAVFSGMLGVTLFGIFFTPSFFYAIDWLGESRVFSIGWVRRLGGFILDVFALRGVRRAGSFLIHRLSEKRRASADNLAGERHPVTVNGPSTNGDKAKDSELTSLSGLKQNEGRRAPRGD